MKPKLKWRTYIKSRIWVSEGGIGEFYIQKLWTYGLGVKSETIYLVFLSKINFDKGINFSRHSTIREAKKNADMIHFKEKWSSEALKERTEL